ncbi:MAG: hypothetical protein JST04_00705 [Bdellovibrionales bacterium]|nr:hypothetical protein [Bdellovibrionales bacterium]
MLDTPKTQLQKITTAVLKGLTVFKDMTDTEHGLDGVKAGFDNVDLSVVASSQDIADSICDVIVSIAKKVTNEDETQMAEVNAAVTDLNPIVKSFADWSKQYIGSNPEGTGPEDE